MKLFYSPFHTFAHKVLITAHECGHWDHLQRVATFPFKNNDGEDCGDAYSRYPWDYYKLVKTVPAEQAFTTKAESACPLWK